ncbi:hypothetical protein CAOG_04945 [Capsaspora owczarzaki ATCC 30864]|nr:hypothetical protein CAOG_04945 [Capsaspora owczarzaki ATCC 30864]|eukprot:XP_004347696.1 hypothetical protein CAOG_04945 [Capsaspora owczarzaki ATCC 30864]
MESMYVPPPSASSQRISAAAEAQSTLTAATAGLPFPLDQPLPLILGASFARDDVSFHGLRYDFKPASIDESKPGSIAVQRDNIRVTVPTTGTHGEAGFAGPKKPAMRECVLIYDRETQQFYLERLTTNITLKQVRETKRKTTTATTTTTSGMPSGAASAGALTSESQSSSATNSPSKPATSSSTSSPAISSPADTLSSAPSASTAGKAAASRAPLARTAAAASPGSTSSSLPATAVSASALNPPAVVDSSSRKRRVAAIDDDSDSEMHVRATSKPIATGTADVLPVIKRARALENLSVKLQLSESGSDSD